MLSDGPLNVDADTKLPVGTDGLRLTFGDIISVAGDYYTYLDERAAADCAEAWPILQGLVKLASGDYTRPTLSREKPAVVEGLLAVATRHRDMERDKLTELSLLAKDGLFGHYPVRRYLALANQNFCHFATPPGTPENQDVGALRWYRYYHERAVHEAARAGQSHDRDALQQALICDSFGCHFLTDLFASGHMRVQRRILGEKLGLWRGSLGLSHEMHCEDNRLGLWCTTQREYTPRRVWLAFGDAMLFSPLSKKHHLQVVQEAVRRSVQEVVDSYDGKPLVPEQSAMALIPVPLRPGELPKDSDVLPLEPTFPTLHLFQGLGPNHYPLVVYLPGPNLIARRCGSEEVNVYSDVSKKQSSLFSIDFSVDEPRLRSERIDSLK